MKEIEIFFEEFGLSSTEGKLYLTLLEKGPSTVLELSKLTNINRTTVHMSINQLIDIGLVSQINRGFKRYVIGEPPEKFKSIIEDEKLKIKRKEGYVSEMIKGIYDSINNIKENTDSDVRFYRGVQNVSRLYDMLSNVKEYRAYVNTTAIWSVFPDNKNRFTEFAKNGLEIKEIVENSSHSKFFINQYKSYDNFKFKMLPEGIDIGTVDYMIFDGKIIVIDLLPEPIGIVIRNKALFEHSKIVFNLMWQMLPDNS